MTCSLTFPFCCSIYFEPKKYNYEEPKYEPECVPEDCYNVYCTKYKKIAFKKKDDGPCCKYWSYVAASREDKVELKNGSYGRFAAPGDGKLEVKAGRNCFDISCDHKPRRSYFRRYFPARIGDLKYSCEYSGKKY